MPHPSSPSPQGENAMTQDEEIKQIASQMDWNDHGDAPDESGDDEGPQIGRGAYVGRVWQEEVIADTNCKCNRGRVCSVKEL